MVPKSLLLGFLTGGTVVGLITLLSAPTSGKETRRKLLENKNLVVEELNELKQNLLEIKDSVTIVSTEGKSAIIEFVQDVKVALQGWKADTSEIKDELAKEFKELGQTIEDLEKQLSPSLEK